MLNEIRNIKFTRRDKIFMVSGVILGFLTHGFVGAIGGAIFGFCIGEVINIIDFVGKKWQK